METKKYTEKEVIALLIKQRLSDAKILVKESNVSGYTANRKVLLNPLVLKKSDIKE